MRPVLCTVYSAHWSQNIDSGSIEIDFLWVFQDVFAFAFSFSSSLEIIAAHVFRNILLFFISFLHTVSSFTEKSGRTIKIEHFWMNQIESNSIWWKCIKNRIVTKRAIVCDCCCCCLFPNWALQVTAITRTRVFVRVPGRRVLYIYLCNLDLKKNGRNRSKFCWNFI